MNDRTHPDTRLFFRILWKRRWIALIVLMLAAAGSAVYGWLHPNMYKSEIRVTLLRSNDFPAYNDNSTLESRINWFHELMLKPAVFENTIKKLKMYGYGTHTDFVMKDANGTHFTLSS